MSARPPRWDAFISYARADIGFVDALLAALPARRGRRWRLWVDRSAMPSRGEPFPHEISRAIASCDRLVALLTDAALASPWVQAEWRQALAGDQPVVPLLRLDPPPADPADGHARLPRELADLQADDLSGLSVEDCARRLAARLAERVQKLGPLSVQVPHPPPFHLERPAVQTALAQLLRPASITTRSRTVLLHGMSGAGKSVAAAAFARAAATRRAFDDGVVWLRAADWEHLRPGAAPDLPLDIESAAQHALVRELGAMPGGAVSLAHLREPQCRLLLVVDDIRRVDGWQALARLLGPNVCTLLTSQQRDLAPALGAAAFEIGTLAPADSVALLARVAGTAPEALPPSARQLAERHCGGLPYALAVTGAMAVDDSWDDVLARLERSDLPALARTFPDYPHPSVFAMLDAAATRLDAASRRLLRALHVFGAMQPVPEVVLTRYVQRLLPQPDDAARARLSRLAQASLIATEGRSPAREVRMHELLLRYGAATCEPPDDDPRMLAGHAAQACREAGGPASDDATTRRYRARALVPMLLQAGDADALCKLLVANVEASADPEAQPDGLDWYREKAAVGDFAGYVDDIDRAWALQAREPQHPQAAQRTLWYALLASTGRALHAQLPEPLKVESLERGLVSADALLSQPELHDSAFERARHLAELLPALAGERRRAVQQRIEALAADCTSAERIELRLRLAAHDAQSALTPSAQVWEEAGRTLDGLPLAIARGRLAALPGALPADVAQARAQLESHLGEAAAQDALVALLPRLAPRQRREAIDALLRAGAAAAPWDRQARRARAARLARLLPWAGPARKRRIVETALRLDVQHEEGALEPFARWLPVGYARRLLDQALEAVQARGDAYELQSCVEALRLLASQQQDLAADLPRVLACVDRWPGFEGGFGRYGAATARARLVPCMPPQERAALWDAAMQAAARLPRLHQRQQAWMALRESAPGEAEIAGLLNGALATAQGVEDESEMLRLVAALAPRLDAAGLAFARTMLAASAQAFERHEVEVALAARALRLGDPAPARQLVEGAEASRRAWGYRFVPLVLLLGDDAADAFWQRIEPASWLRSAGEAWALGALAARLPKRLEALLAAADFKDRHEGEWDLLAGELARQGRPDLAFRVVQSVGGALTPAQIAGETGPGSAAEAVARFVRAVERSADAAEIDAVRLFLGPDRVGADAFAQALQALAARPLDGEHPEALPRGLRHVDQAARERWFAPALKAALAPQDVGQRALALGALAEVAPLSAREPMAEALRTLPPERQWAAVGFAARLAELGVTEAALAHARSLPERDRAGALVALAARPAGTAALLHEALEAVCSLPDRFGRWPMLDAATPAALRLAPDVSQTLLDRTLQRLARRPRRELLADLRGVAAWLAGLHGAPALAQLLQAVAAVRRRWP